MTEKEILNQITEAIIGSAVKVHSFLGPGLLESAYVECLCFELKSHAIAFTRQAPLPVVYKSVKLECGYRMDLVVENRLVVEVKTVEKLLPVHDAQLLTYLNLSGIRVGLLLNFNAPVLKRGIRRLVL